MFDFCTWSKKLILALAIVSGEGTVVNAQDFLGWKPQWLHPSDVDYVEPIRTYSDGYNVAKDEQRPLLILVSTKPCLPCRVAKKLIEDMRAEHSLGNCVLVEMQLSDPEVKALLNKRTAPQLLILDFANIGEKGAVGIEPIATITRQNITAAIANLPAKIEQPIALEQFVETFDSPLSSPPMGAMVVTYSISTEYKTGQYNGTFAWNDIQYILDGHQKFGVHYKRVNTGAQWQIRQGNKDLGRDVAARHGSGITRISPTFRFYNAIQAGMVLWHENRHHASPGHTGSGLMGPSGGYQITAEDIPYFAKFPIKPTLEDPDWLKRYLSRNASLGSDDGKMFPLMNVQRDRN